MIDENKGKRNKRKRRKVIEGKKLSEEMAKK